jgi:signal transduction histidine kinase
VKAPSLEGRLVLLQLLLAAAVIALFAGSAIFLSARTLEREELNLLSGAARQFASSLEDEWREHGDLNGAVADAIKIDQPAGVGVEVFDESHHLVGGTPAPAAHASSAPLREYAIHMPRGAWVVVRLSTGPRRRAIAALITAMTLAALPLLLLSLALSRALARRALRPLSRMTALAESAATNGRLEPLAGRADPQEVARLADAFHRLFARLEALIESERRFARDAAHELRTPLTVISGELERFAGDLQLPSIRRESLRIASDQARDMSALVEALLLLGRTEQARGDLQGLRSAVNLSDMAREATDELGARMPHRKPDVVLESQDEVLVNGDPQLLSAAIRNLLTNALKATSPSGHVRVSVFTSQGESVVVVDDDGPGVSPGDRERIFDTFYRSPRARAEQSGFGLGLPLLRRVARAHRGDVTVETSPLGGARFEMRMPAWAPLESAAAR